jgi:hypothetical protein
VRRPALLGLALCALLLAAAPARAASTKAIWGPAVNASDQPCPGCSVFPTYADLGVDVYQFQIKWDEVAPTPPANPRDPFDPAYKWPTIQTLIVNEAGARGIALAAMVKGSPTWANGGRDPRWAPNSPQALADFMYAASLRYPSIRRWMVWGEASFGADFQPQGAKVGPRIYAALLDAAYTALKQASPSNVVIGGMTLNGGTVFPAAFIQNLRLKSGRRPRMDLWGHNPFDPRFPNLKQKPRGKFRGLNDLDTIWDEIKEAYRRQKRGRPRRLWLSEWTVQSDHDSTVFNFHVSREQQARYVTAAYRLARRLKYVDALGWFSLYDAPEGPLSPTWGLLTYNGLQKPAYSAYKSVP